jgi:hypothetical protein
MAMMARARNTLTAPTQPTEDVTCVVNVNLRRAAVMVMMKPTFKEGARHDLGRDQGDGHYSNAVICYRCSRLLINAEVFTENHQECGRVGGVVPPFAMRRNNVSSHRLAATSLRTMATTVLRAVEQLGPDRLEDFDWTLVPTVRLCF